MVEADYDAVRAAVPDAPSTMWALACLLPQAHGRTMEESKRVLKDSWDDVGDGWAVYANGSGEEWIRLVDPYSEHYPSPAAVEVPAGAHLILVEDEALFIAKPDGNESFTDPGDHDEVKIWERATISALYDRLDELEANLPDRDEVVP